eukprot:1483152-Prorocentrum_lima.AAC.1
MLSRTNEKNETLATTDIANAFLHAQITKDKTIVVAMPNIPARLGIVGAGTVWMIGRGVTDSRKAP